MKRKIYNFIHRSLLLKLFCLFFISTSFGLSAQMSQITNTTYFEQTDAEKKISLEKALDKLAATFDANLVYDDAHVKDHSVEIAELNGDNIESVLKRILKPLELSFKKLSKSNYVIKPLNNKKGISQNKNSNNTISSISKPPTKIPSKLEGQVRRHQRKSFESKKSKFRHY